MAITRTGEEYTADQILEEIKQDSYEQVVNRLARQRNKQLRSLKLKRIGDYK